MIPLTGTSSQKHLRDDLECYDFQLSDADIALLTGIGV
jgi:diketogulonate reductase-like aldo/keto reductase